jgi:hypothetical protein
VFFIKKIGFHPRVMAHCFWDPETSKGPGFKPSGVQVKLLLALCQMSLTLGFEELVRSGLLLCFKENQ